MAKQRTHNEYFRRVFVRTLYGNKHRDPQLIMEILSRPGNRYTYDELAASYRTIVGEESRRKSCPSCKERLEKDEWVWSWGEYVNAKWRTVRHFCKHCFPEVRRDLQVHRDDCGCNFNLICKDSIECPSWLRLDYDCDQCKDALELRCGFCDGSEKGCEHCLCGFIPCPCLDESNYHESTLAGNCSSS